MKHRPPFRWFVGLALLLLLGPPLALYWLSPTIRALPVARFLPGQASVILRLAHAGHAWQEHWQGRAGPTPVAPEDAIQQIMEATGAWAKWVKKYGTTGARMRLSLYQNTIFSALGDEAWLIFGEWGGDGQPGRGQAGLVILLRGNSSIKTHLGTLAGLFIKDSKLMRKETSGVPVFEYVGKGQARSLAFCQLGGWICASLRQRGEGPLPALIEQVQSGRGKGKKQITVGPVLPAQTTPVAVPGLALAATPELFLRQLREFTTQSGRGFSPASEQRMAEWTRTLAGVERLSLTQTGRSLFDLQLDLVGTSSTLIRQIAQSGDGAKAKPVEAAKDKETKAVENSTASSATGSPAGALLAQVDLAVPAAHQSLSLFGVSWENVLGQADYLDLFAPGLRGALTQVLAAPAGGAAAPAQGRVGLAAWPSAGGLIPGLLFWHSLGGEQGFKIAPGEAWADPAMQAREGGRGEGKDGAARWITPAADGANAGAPLAQNEQWRAFENKVWGLESRLPLVFLTINFKNIAAELDRVPTLFFGKKARKQFKTWQGTLRGLAMTMHGVALRLDAENGAVRISARTPY